MSFGHEGGGVAFFAHIGGFLAGMVLIGLFKHPHVRFFNQKATYRGSDRW
jgi:membrane associated rhomboid family serine protease